MYLSTLLIDVGDNPDRLRPGRQWLRNLYRVHQRLCMAFPSASRRSDDVDFLEPFRSSDFGEGHVHVTRATGAGFLFRIDPVPNGRAVILVQSAGQPDWEYAFHNARHFLSAPPRVRPVDLSFDAGEQLRFRLLANPTRKVGTLTKSDRVSHPIAEFRERAGRHGKREPVPCSREIREWLAKHPEAREDPRPFIQEKLKEWLMHWRPTKNGRRADSGGFTIDPESTVIHPGYVYFDKSSEGQGGRLRSARYEGILAVDDPELFALTLASGIGPGKGLGFGLLSVVPLRNRGTEAMA